MGLLTIALGAVAVIVSFQSDLAFEIWVGLIFIATGLTHALHSFWSRPWRGFFFQLFGAVHYLLVGMIMLANPVSSVAMLVMLLAILFIMQGMVQFGLVSELPPNVNKNFLLVRAYPNNP